MNKCSTSKCTRKYYAKGFCGACYTSNRLKSNPGLQEVYRRNQQDRSLKNLYGITASQYSSLLAKQNNSCAICHSQSPKANSKYFHVDHCHVTKKVRGLLCIECNLGLGKFQDNPQNLLKAALYLEFTK